MRCWLGLLAAANASLFQYFRRHREPVKDAIPAAIASTTVRANASGHFPFDWKRLTLCEVLRKRGRQQKTPGGHALLVYATDQRYLDGVQTKAHRALSLRYAFSKKLRYCTKKKLRLFALLGRFNEEKTCPLSQNFCHQMLRVAGLAALLDRRGPEGQKFESVTYADLDTVPVDFTVTPAHYLALASSADLIGSANAAGMPILMNSGLLIVRNTAWSRSVLLEAWWRRRAQTPDQLSLWEALFEGWGDAYTFANYAAGHREALLRLLQQRLGGPCAASETCQNILERTGCLAAPLQVGRVLLLPARFAIGALPPLQADHVHARPWFCHKKCGRSTRRRLGGHSWGRHGRRTNDTSFARCRNATAGFVCRCADVADTHCSAVGSGDGVLCPRE